LYVSAGSSRVASTIGGFSVSPRSSHSVLVQSPRRLGAWTPGPGQFRALHTFDAKGRPVFNTQGLISLCPGGSTSRQPLWSLTAQSEYVHPVRDNLDGFLRGLLNYYPENERVEPDLTVPSYTLVNVYAGLRAHDGAWEISLFARNLFNTFRATDISPLDAGAPLSNPLADFPSLIHPTGYFETLTTAPREVGINLHYAWGSR
jgi:hypothetical protein